jgi:hypothetical protein
MAEYGTQQNPPSPDPSQLPDASRPTGAPASTSSQPVTEPGQPPPQPQPPLSPEEEQARVLYSTYRLHVGGLTEAGVGMPQWEGLSIPMRNAWSAVGAAARGEEAPPAPETTASSPTSAPQTPSGERWTQEDLAQRTETELRDLCTQAGVSVAPSASKQERIDALLAHQTAQEEAL